MPWSRVQNPGLRKRKEIFASLLAMQDAGTRTVHDTRVIACDTFLIGEATLLRIEEEGTALQSPNWLEQIDEEAATAKLSANGVLP